MSKNALYGFVAALIIASIAALVIVASDTSARIATEQTEHELGGVSDYELTEVVELAPDPNNELAYVQVYDDDEGNIVQVTWWPAATPDIPESLVLDPSRPDETTLYNFVIGSTDKTPYLEIHQGIDMNGHPVEGEFFYKFFVNEIDPELDINADYFENLSDEQRTAYDAYEMLSDEDKELADAHGWATMDGVAYPLDEDGNPIME